MPSCSMIWCGVKNGGVDQSEAEELSRRVVTGDSFVIYLLGCVRSILRNEEAFINLN